MVMILFRENKNCGWSQQLDQKSSTRFQGVVILKIFQDWFKLYPFNPPAFFEPTACNSELCVSYVRFHHSPTLLPLPPARKNLRTLSYQPASWEPASILFYSPRIPRSPITPRFSVFFWEGKRGGPSPVSTSIWKGDFEGPNIQPAVFLCRRGSVPLPTAGRFPWGNFGRAEFLVFPAKSALPRSGPPALCLPESGPPWSWPPLKLGCLAWRAPSFMTVTCAKYTRAAVGPPAVCLNLPPR